MASVAGGLRDLFADYGSGERNRSHRNFAISAGFVPVPSEGGASSPPVVQNVSPAPGTPLLSSEKVSFDVVDVDPGLQQVLVWALLGDADEPLLVWDGAIFHGRFAGASSIGAITNGFHFVVGMTGGWIGQIRGLTVRAFDDVGARVD